MSSVGIARLALAYLKALAWPLIVLFIALVFKEEFRKLLDRLKEVKGGGFGASFGKRVLEAQVAAEAAADEEQPAPAVDDEPNQGEFDTIRTVADELPAAAVLAAWSLVERKLLDGARLVVPEEELRRPRNRLPNTLISALGRAGLSPMTAVALNGLRDLRNQAAHGEGQISPQTAHAYIDTAELGTRLLSAFIAGLNDT